MKSIVSGEITDNSYKSIRVDFHSHTNCSDGRLTPAELLDRASNHQIDQFAITDHDTIAAFDIAKQHIADKNLNIRLICGIEISTMWQNHEIHVVGLNVDENNPALLKLIDEQQQARETRALLMAEKLAKAGVENCYADAKELAQGGTITRAHFARVLYNRGIVSTMQKAFDKYIGKGNRAYVKPLWCSIEQAIDVIKQAGGQSVIAHPMKYDLSTKWIRRLIIDFVEAKGDAMEVASPQMNSQQKQLSVELCKQYGLKASVGSDFHFPSRWTELGRNLSVPDDLDVVWQHWN
ncbi:PHP domain-containing protein [Thalassotalea psychrophila]|uniref:PHP domain-containing protein n=1 Tax=Thalassotalea psychrophila TaxID=3065647 RepID=A0ABY9TQQ2_9GAMM|nr:PHP domain-containing protein [Colwelliaceae bacterium SQ149]